MDRCDSSKDPAHRAYPSQGGCRETCGISIKSQEAPLRGGIAAVFGWPRASIFAASYTASPLGFGSMLDATSSRFCRYSVSCFFYERMTLSGRSMRPLCILKPVHVLWPRAAATVALDSIPISLPQDLSVHAFLSFAPLPKPTTPVSHTPRRRWTREVAD